MNQSYYPKTNDGRADWWQNVADNIGVLTGLGFSVTESGLILADAKWGVYLYRTIREAFDNLQKATLAWADVYLDAAVGTSVPTPPNVPSWPALPADGIAPGIEERRVQWVARAKASPSYNPPIGAQLGTEATGDGFDEATYKAILSNLASPSAYTVTGKFRKAGGQIDGINLYGRKEGTMAWIFLGRFNATPFSALVPLAGAAPEPWEFLARAVKRDVEIGVPSDVVQVIVRG
ncbi:MAG TPA: hypothetical protein VGO11_01515 [Chthoniobacteraceae bacterium]|jgi:hypothetical protein|nr:hypothetical protein [Chthoniobacteraceae bacterium]